MFVCVCMRSCVYVFIRICACVFNSIIFPTNQHRFSDTHTFQPSTFHDISSHTNSHVSFTKNVFKIISPHNTNVFKTLTFPNQTLNHPSLFPPRHALLTLLETADNLQTYFRFTISPYVNSRYFNTFLIPSLLYATTSSSGIVKCE